MDVVINDVAFVGCSSSLCQDLRRYALLRHEMNLVLIVGLEDSFWERWESPGEKRSGLHRKESMVEKSWSWKETTTHLNTSTRTRKETIYCFKGEVDIVLNDRVVTLKEGDDITLIPRTVHRIIGKANSVLFEVSTPQLADVIRLEEE